jgi:hypothetical protein
MICANFVRNSFAATAFFLIAFCCPSYAQGPFPDAPKPSAETPAPMFITTTTVGSEQHKFFDKYNIALFTATAALASTDFAVTRANLQSNGQELNPVVRMFGRSTAGLALNFAGEAAGSMGLSYFFHKTGHHKLERAVSGVNIGASAFAVGYSLAHR